MRKTRLLTQEQETRKGLLETLRKQVEKKPSQSSKMMIPKLMRFLRRVKPKLSRAERLREVRILRTKVF